MKEEPKVIPDPVQPATLLRRIGSTTYKVSVYFSQTSRESLCDKITRLIHNDMETRRAVTE